MAVLDRFMQSFGDERSRQENLRNQRQALQDRQDQLKRADEQLAMQRDQAHRADAFETLKLISDQANSVDLWRDNPAAIADLEQRASFISQKLGGGPVTFQDPRHAIVQTELSKLFNGDMTDNQITAQYDDMERLLGKSYIQDWVSSYRNTTAASGGTAFKPQATAPIDPKTGQPQVTDGSKQPRPAESTSIANTGMAANPAMGSQAPQAPAMPPAPDAGSLAPPGITVTPTTNIPGMDQLPPAGQEMVNNIQQNNPNLAPRDVWLAMGLANQHQKKETAISDKLATTPNPSLSIGEIRRKYPEETKLLTDPEVAAQYGTTANQQNIDDRATARLELDTQKAHESNALNWAKFDQTNKKISIDEDRLDFDMDKFKSNLDYQKNKLSLMDKWEQAGIKSRESIASQAQAGANSRSAASQAGANARTAVSQTGQDRRQAIALAAKTTKNDMSYSSKDLMNIGFPSSAGIDKPGASDLAGKLLSEGYVKVDPFTKLLSLDQKDDKAKAEVAARISGFMDSLSTETPAPVVKAPSKKPAPKPQKQTQQPKPVQKAQTSPQAGGTERNVLVKGQTVKMTFTRGK